MSQTDFCMKDVAKLILWMELNFALAGSCCYATKYLRNKTFVVRLP